MGVYSHGPVSSAIMRVTDHLMNTGDLFDWCVALGIDTSDVPESDLWDYARQKIVDHFAVLAGEIKGPDPRPRP